MLQKVQSALLLTTAETFGNTVQFITTELGIDLQIEKEWGKQYKVSKEVILCSAKYLKDINEEYYKRVVVVLKPTDSIEELIEIGIERFVFNFENLQEIACAFFFPQNAVLYTHSKDLLEIVQNSCVTSFCKGDYRFDFLKDMYFYKGKEIYLKNYQKLYLAEWLLKHKKDNSRRNTLTVLRKTFGNVFLKDVDRMGKFKGEEDV